jgi:hypothetical protein
MLSAQGRFHRLKCLQFRDGAVEMPEPAAQFCQCGSLGELMFCIHRKAILKMIQPDSTSSEICSEIRTAGTRSAERRRASAEITVSQQLMNSSELVGKDGNIVGNKGETWRAG